MHSQTVTGAQVYLFCVILGLVALCSVVLHPSSSYKKIGQRKRTWLIWGVVTTIIGFPSVFFFLAYFLLGPTLLGRAVRFVGRGFGTNPNNCFDCRGQGRFFDNGTVTSVCNTCGGTGNRPRWDKRGLLRSTGLGGWDT